MFLSPKTQTQCREGEEGGQEMGVGVEGKEQREV